MKNIIKKTGHILMKIGYYLSMILFFLLMLFYQIEYYQDYDDFTLNDYIYQIPFIVVCFYFYLYKRKFRYFSFGLIVISIYLLYQCILFNFEILNVYTIVIFNVFLVYLIYLIYLIEKNKEYILKINYLKIFLLIIVSYYSLFYSYRVYIYSKINYIEKDPEYSFYLNTPSKILYTEDLKEIKLYNQKREQTKIELNKDNLFKKQIYILNLDYNLKQIINYKEDIYNSFLTAKQIHKNKFFKYKKDDFLTKINYETLIAYSDKNKVNYFYLKICSSRNSCFYIDDLPENKKNELIELNNKIRQKYNIKE